MGRKWGNNVLNTFHINDHLIMVKIKASPVNLVVIQVFMPTTNSRDEEVGEVYDQMDELFGVISKNDNVIIMGNFNASVYNRPAHLYSLSR